MVKKEPARETVSRTDAAPLVAATTPDTTSSELLWARLMQSTETSKSPREVASSLYLMLQVSKFAQNPSKENRTMLTKTVNVLKKIGNTVCSIIGPQEAEACL